jgi:hypothetical protein
MARKRNAPLVHCGFKGHGPHLGRVPCDPVRSRALQTITIKDFHLFLAFFAVRSNGLHSLFSPGGYYHLSASELASPTNPEQCIIRFKTNFPWEYTPSGTNYSWFGLLFYPFFPEPTVTLKARSATNC